MEPVALEPLIALAVVAGVARAVWRAVGDAVDECERRRKRIARERKQRELRRLDRQVWRRFRTNDVVAVVRPKGQAARLVESRANDMYDRRVSTARMSWQAWAPRVVLPAPPARRRRRRSGRRR